MSKRKHPANKKKISQTLHTEEFFSRTCACTECVQLRLEEANVFKHIITCDDANKCWHPDMWRCVVCLATYDEYGFLKHKELWYQ